MEENIEQITQDPEYATHADLESLKTEITEEYTAAIEDAIDDAVDKGDMNYVTEAELRKWKAGKIDCENAISAINATINNIMQTIGTADAAGSIVELLTQIKADILDIIARLDRIDPPATNEEEPTVTNENENV